MTALIVICVTFIVCFVGMMLSFNNEISNDPSWYEEEKWGK